MSKETRKLNDVDTLEEGKKFFETEMKEEKNTIEEDKEKAFKEAVSHYVRRYEKSRRLRKKAKDIGGNIKENIKELLNNRNKESHETEEYKVTISKQSRLSLTTDNLKDVLSDYLKDNEIEEVLDSMPTINYDRMYITNRNDEHEKEVINYVQEVTKEV